MKKTPRVLSLFLALVLSVSLCVPAAQAVGSSEEVTEPLITIGTSHDYKDYSATTKFYLYVNEKGGLTRVESNGDDPQIRIEEYDSSFRFLSGRILRYDGLPIWGGFYAGEKYNFIITGQGNPNESDSAEVLRVLKYSKDWQYLGKASVYGHNTKVPINHSGLQCVETGGMLYITTAHIMYKSTKDGKNHQANMNVAVRESDMTVMDDALFSPYVSHSFNQLIDVDQEGYIISANHGDGGPRAMYLARYKPDHNTAKGSFSGSAVTDSFPGSYGDNRTNAMLGGIASTSNGYLLAFCQRESADYPYQVKLAFVSKKNFEFNPTEEPAPSSIPFQVKQITNVQNESGNPYSLPNQGNPYLVSTGPSGGYILWQSAASTVSYASYDVNGQIGAIQSAPGRLSGCRPIVYRGKVVWFSGFYEEVPTFYTLDASGLTAVDPASGASTPSTPSTPSPFKDVPDNHWALEYIRTCAEKGIVTGLGDGSFDPDGTVSYAQFVAMITRAFFNDEVQKVTDTAGKPWYYPYMQAAFSYRLDLFSNIRRYGGWPDVVVADDPINRYDMAAISRQTLLRFSMNPSKEDSTYDPYANPHSIKDYDQFPQPDRYQLYRVEVSICYYYGILTGMEDGCFHGEENMTRAQACVVLVRMMNLLSDKTRRAKEENPVITIECRDRQTNQVLRYYRHLCNSDSTYTFPPTVIDGYTPEETSIKGTASSADSTVVVYYIPN